MAKRSSRLCSTALISRNKEDHLEGWSVKLLAKSLLISRIKEPCSDIPESRGPVRLTSAPNVMLVLSFRAPPFGYAAVEINL